MINLQERQRPGAFHLGFAIFIVLGSGMALLSISFWESRPQHPVIAEKPQRPQAYVYVQKTTCALYLVFETEMHQFPVCVGKETSENETPSGFFRVTEIVPDPPWVVPERLLSQPGKSVIVPPYSSYYPATTAREGNPNPLGVLWIGLSGPVSGIGIHGTNDPKSIGKALSHGCIRMHNHDVRFLADRLRIGDTVIIGSEPFAKRKLLNSDPHRDSSGARLVTTPRPAATCDLMDFIATGDK